MSGYGPGAASGPSCGSQPPRIAGTARSELCGNYFTWRFRLKVADKGPIRHVNMSQCMYLMPDSKTLVIHSVIRKFGFIVREMTEQFHKDD